MPKPRKPSRSRRRRSGRPPLPSPAAPMPSRPIEPSVSDEALETAPAEQASTVQSRLARRARYRAEDPVVDRSARRQMTEDYAYVMKDLRRIVVLATAIIVAIIVLSFFLP